MTNNNSLEVGKAYEEGKYKQAVEIYQNILEKDPKDAIAR